MRIQKICIFIFCSVLSGLAFGQGNVKEQVEKADFLMQNARYEEALLMLEEASKKAPKDASIAFKKADCFINIGKWGDAIASLEQSTKIKTDFFEAYEMLGNLYFQMENAPKAVESYERAFHNDKNPEQRCAYKLQILDILDKIDRHRFAAKHIKDAKSVCGETFDVNFYEAMYFNEMRQYNEALALLEPLIKQVPDPVGNEKYYYQLGFTYHQLGRYAESAAAFKKADEGEFKMKISQFTAEFYLSVAKAYFNVLEYDESTKHLNVALAMNPALTEAFNLKKQLASIKTDNRKIIDALESAVKSEKNPDALSSRLNELTTYHFNGGHFQEALLTADEYMKLKNNALTDFKMIFLKAIIESKLNMQVDATELLIRLVKNPKLSPEDKARYTFALGLIYKNQGNFPLAEETLKSAFFDVYRYAVTLELEDITRLKQEKEINAMSKTE